MPDSGKASRRKGSSGEAEARKAWKARGFECAPWRGGMDGPDFIAIVTDDSGRGLAFSVEVTRDAKRMSPLAGWLNISKAKKGPGIAVSRIRADRKPALIQMTEEDFFKLLGR